MTWMKAALFFALGLGLLAKADAGETLRYVALVDGGKKAGHQLVEQGDDGVTSVDFIFKDNGRGPELKEEFTLGPDGTYVRYAVKGAAEMGAPIDETFRRDGDKAKWKSTSDEGGRPSPERPFTRRSAARRPATPSPSPPSPSAATANCR
jgi:hypothetical protein